jgi:hypothetical protein
MKTWVRTFNMLAVLGVVSVSGAIAQTEITPAASAVTASTSDTNVPGNVVDNNHGTRWSGNGDGAWLQLDLGTVRPVGSVRVAVHQGNSRQNHFELQVSSGAGVWNTVWSGSSSGTTTLEETYDVTDVDARYVRYLGHGSTATTFNSVSEISIYAGVTGPEPTATPTPTPTTVPTVTPTPLATSTPTPTPVPSEIELTPAASGVTGSTHDGNLPANTVDGNLATRWSANGDGQWVRYDLGATKNVAYVKIAVYNGNARQNRFDIQLSADGTSWSNALTGGLTSGTTTQLETHDFPDAPARYVRYLGHSATTSTFNSVTEVEIWGNDCTSCPTPVTPTPTITPTPTNTPTPTPPARCTPPSGNSALWNNFVQAKANGTQPTLPDFSYAGYKRSDVAIPNITGPVFNVTSYGASPNNTGFDDAGIQAAIDAAEAAGGGVVFFPAGQYRVAPTEDSTKWISIQGSNIVLRGAGSGTGGSDILMVSKKQGGKMFRIGPASGWGATTVANVTAAATRETFWVTVDSTSQLSVGQIVVLKHQDTEYNSFYFNNMPLDPDWVRVVGSGVGVHEMHEIAEIASGNRVRFKEPLHFTIRLDSTPWRLDRVSPLREVGIENLRFSGSWDTYPETFVHHKDWIHDSGWSLISWRESVNCWVRNVEFRNFNDALGTDSVGWMTIENVRFTGKKGHSSIGGRRGYGMLVRDAVDTASTHHGPDTGYNLVGAVYLRFTMAVNASVDNHGGVPHACLLDDVTGGVLTGNGGPIDNYPHTGRYYTLWNFRHRATSGRTYDFWDAVNRNSNTFALPIFSGFTADTAINLGVASEMQVNESQGTRVTPTSLFEAQLALRQCQ